MTGEWLKLGCASITNAGQHEAEMVEPLLPEEGVAVVQGYKFAPKAARQTD